MLVRVIGVTQTFKVVAYRMIGSKKVSVRVNSIDHEVLVRMNNCDLPLLSDIFCSDECEMSLSWSPETIIDLGANIGLTAIKLSRQFPSARIIAVEPDPGTVEICASNLKVIPRCIVLHRAVGFQSIKVACSNPSEQAISRQFSVCPDDEPEGVETISIGSILMEQKCPLPILIKMDIEGAEEECFQHADEWLNEVRAVLVEPHSEAIHSAICKTLSEHGFSTKMIGEKIYGERVLAGTSEGCS